MPLDPVEKILQHSKSHALRMILESSEKHPPTNKDFRLPFTVRASAPESTQVHPENTQWKVSQILLKYCDPKPEYSGLTAWELAGKIMEIMK